MSEKEELIKQMIEMQKNFPITNIRMESRQKTILYPKPAIRLMGIANNTQHLHAGLLTLPMKRKGLRFSHHLVGRASVDGSAVV